MFVVEKVVHSLMTACSPPVSVFCQYLPLGVLEHFHILLHFQRNFTFVITIYIWQSDHKPWADWSRFEGGKYFSTDRFGRMSSDAHSSNATRSVSGVFLDSPHTIRTVLVVQNVRLTHDRNCRPCEYAMSRLLHLVSHFRSTSRMRAWVDGRHLSALTFSTRRWM